MSTIERNSNLRADSPKRPQRLRRTLTSHNLKCRACGNPARRPGPLCVRCHADAERRNQLVTPGSDPIDFCGPAPLPAEPNPHPLFSPAWWAMQILRAERGEQLRHPDDAAIEGAEFKKRQRENAEAGGRERRAEESVARASRRAA